MKTTESLSAFAIYKQTLHKNSDNKPLSHRRNKFKAKLKSKAAKKPAATGLNSKKVQLAFKQDIGLKQSSKVQSDKFKMNSPQKQKRVSESTNLKPNVAKNIVNIEQNQKLKKHKKKSSKNIPKGQIIQNGKKKMKVKVEKNNKPVIEGPSKNRELPTDTSYDPCTQDPFMKGYQLFEWMIAPMTPKSFLENFWETEPLYVARSNKNYYAHLLTSRQLDQIFRENSLYYTRNVDVVTYENEEKQVLNPEGKANPAALWDFYSNGCSIRVLNPQTYNKKVHLLVSTLQEYFGSMVGVNVYLTPPGSQGFAPHFDDIEAFVIQLEGRKHWKLYQPVGQDVLTRHSSKNLTHEEIGEPFLEVALEAGSLLYFPRGVIHEGKTDSESHSLHLTVSLYQNNAYVDLLEKVLPNALAKAAKSDIDFRKGLPLHFLRSEDAKQIIAEKVSALMEKLTEYLDIDTGISELGRKMVYDSMPPVLSSEEIACSSKQDGDLLDNGVVYNKVEFDLATKIRLTRYHCIQLVYDDEMNPKLYYSTENAKVYHGEEEQWLELDPSMVPAVEALKKAYPFYIGIGFLPIDGVELKVQFVYDLWEKGIVITKEPLGNSSNDHEMDDNDDEDGDSSEND